MAVDDSFQRRSEFNFYNLSCPGVDGQSFLIYLENPQGLYYEGIEFYINNRILTLYFRNDDEWHTTIFTIVDTGSHDISSSVLKKVLSSNESNSYKLFMNYYSPYVPLFCKLIKNTVEGNVGALHYEQIECPTDGQLYDAFAIQIKNHESYEQLDHYLVSQVEPFLNLCNNAFNELLKLPDISENTVEDYAADRRMLTKGLIKNFVKLGITVTTGIPTVPSFSGLLKYKTTRPY